jgi:uncharacterized protein (TIGR02246 family)
MSHDLESVRRMAESYTVAWNAKDPDAVAGHYAADGSIVINCGDPWEGRAKVSEMAAGFYADVPDLSLTCDDLRIAGDHVIYVWTFTGHDAGTGNSLEIRGWEEWEIGDDLKVTSSRGWSDAEGYARQVAGG